MGRKYILVEFCVKIFTYLILCEKLFRKKSRFRKMAKKKHKKARKRPKIKKKRKSRKKPEFFWVIQFRIVRNELWYTWAFFLLRQ